MSICTVESYRKFTGDHINFDGDVINALAQAQTEIEDRTERKFESATRTETLAVRTNGRVYPDAYPITAVTSPSDAVVDSPGVIVSSPLNTRWDSTLVPTSATYPPWTGPILGYPVPVTQSVTYTGGFTTIPDSLQRLCAQMAQLVLAPFLPVSLPTPASTADLEGYSAPPLSVLTEWPPLVIRQIKRWQHIKTKLTM